MLYKTLMVCHLIGLSIGAGTGVYIDAIVRHATRNLEPSGAQTLIPGINNVIASVGHIGLLLLLLSGLGLVAMMGTSGLGSVFFLKMLCVSAIVIFVGVMHMLAKRVRQTKDVKAMLWMKRIGPVGPILALLTIVAAVSAFH